MTSNQDPKQNKLSIPMTGIEVMNDLSLDATSVLFLAYKGLLKPFIPPVLNPMWMEFCMSSRDNPPEDNVPQFMYWKTDVEEFKLSHKDYWEELRQQKANANDHPKMTTPILPQSGTNLGDKMQKGRLEGDNPPSAADYINRRRKEGVKDEILASELHDQGGRFKLSYADVARALDLTEGLNKDQHAALKQRGKRLCERGRAILQKQ